MDKEEIRHKRPETCSTAGYMLGVKPTDHVLIKRAYGSLGWTSLRVLYVDRHTLVWARLLAMELVYEDTLPKYCQAV